MSKPKTSAKVVLLGVNGNAISILGTVIFAMKKAGVIKRVQDEFLADATSDDYDHLLSTVFKYVDVVG